MMSGRHQLIFINALTGAFAFGIAAAGWVSLPLFLLYGMIAVSIIFSAAAVRAESRRAGWGVLLLFLLLGYMRCSHDLVLSASDISHCVGETVRVAGTVADAPRVKATDADQVSVRYTVEAREVRRNGQASAASGKLSVYVSQKAAAPIASYGDALEVQGEVKGLRGYLNPGLIDSAAALRRQGVTARLHAGKRGATITPTETRPLLRVIDLTRKELLTRMENVMPKQDAAALFAMLFGGYDGIKPELLEAFTATGIVHILSVSGSHITMLAAFLQWFGGFLRLRGGVTVTLIIACISLYAIFSGCSAPVVRSALMGSLTFAAMALGREKDARRILALVLLSMLAVSPRMIYDISFQLSFAATAGLLYLSPMLMTAMQRLPKWVAGNLAITIAAQLSALPFLAWYFNTVSLSALLANIVAVPVIECMIVGGLGAVVIGVFLPFLQNILLVLCSLGMGLVYTITRAVALIPGGALHLPTGLAVYGAFYYAILMFIAWCVHEKKEYCRKKLKQFHREIIIGVAITSCALFFYVNRPEPVRVHFIDVGQGDAMLLTTPHGKAVLIDTGGTLSGDFDVGARVVVPYLKHYGVRELSYLILTHAHEDHAGGAAAVRRAMPIDHIVVGREDRMDYARVFKSSLQECAALIPAYSGQKFSVDGVAFEIVHATDAASRGSTGNEVSNVVRIDYGKHRFLITGDLDANGEAKTLTLGADIQSTVLKVGHHGSKTSSTEAFLAAVAPRYAVISVGADNHFGHPNQDVVKRLMARRAQVLRTDESGAIVFTSDGEKLSVRTFQ